MKVTTEQRAQMVIDAAELKRQGLNGPQAAEKLGVSLTTLYRLWDGGVRTETKKVEEDVDPSDIEGEVWKDVPGYEGFYRASSFGRVRSCNRVKGVNGALATRRGAILKTAVDRDGYEYLGLCLGGEVKTIKAHRLIADIFLENPQSLPQVNHKDGVRSNNAASNLEWVTQSMNMRHAFDDLGRKSWQHGSEHGNTLLKSQDILDIFRLALAGETQAAIGAKYDVERSYISKILWRKCRLDVDVPLDMVKAAAAKLGGENEARERAAAEAEALRHQNREQSMKEVQQLKENIAKLHAQGMSGPKIAEELGVHVSTVYRSLV